MSVITRALITSSIGEEHNIRTGNNISEGGTRACDHIPYLWHRANATIRVMRMPGCVDLTKTASLVSLAIRFRSSGIFLIIDHANYD